jgi:glucose/arabinose dehydrogenase/mono/diheme cytochrome c family protein
MMRAAQQLCPTFVAIAASVAVMQAAMAQVGDPVRGAGLFRARCALCHINAGAGGQGPNLNGVVGRRPATTRFAYSQALQQLAAPWDRARLDSYLQNPAAEVPGTAMALAVPDASDRADLIAYLVTLRAAGQPSAGTTQAPAATNPSAFGDWRADLPGRRHRITLADLPAPYETASSGNPPHTVPRPASVRPQAPAGFSVDLFAEGLNGPRIIRTAPNGDLFVAETAAGRVRVLRPDAQGKRADRNQVYANGLRGPFGIAFYPAGPEPQWIYIAENNRVVRFVYKSGDLHARSAPEVIVAQLSPGSGGHVTRDIAFSKDGNRMFISIGSASNVAQDMPPRSPEAIRSWETRRGLGAAWGFEENRAVVLVSTPQGKGSRVFAAGIRNCVGLAVQPQTGDVYCSTNERDGLGDNLVPDYITRVREGAFYGWPWWYMGNHQDPRWKSARSDLAGKLTDPDVLVQPHSAALGMTFYTGSTFPAAYTGSAFAAFHGSWNRATRTGYKVVRIIMRDGIPTGDYEDFLTGFVIDDARVWGRPVGVTTGNMGALFVSEDANGTIWRVSSP